MARELNVISNSQKVRQPKPEWLRIRLGDPTNQNQVLQLIEGLNLHTVCQEARCPNIFECWSDRTATFMLGGDICTRHCGFCAVGKGQPGSLDPEEPVHVAEATKHLNLAHVVITSVNRDDLPVGGAAHWAETIRQVRAVNPDCKVEVLIQTSMATKPHSIRFSMLSRMCSITTPKQSRVSIDECVLTLFISSHLRYSSALQHVVMLKIEEC